MLRKLKPVIAFVAVAMPVTTADAGRGITCKGGAQLVSGSYLITPYCQDELLAQVAREHGMKASADRIRSNPSYKRYVCRFAGTDIRVYEHCAIERPGRSGGSGGID